MAAILQELLEPWAITEDSFRVLVEQTKALMARDAVAVADTANVTMRGDVAVMHVKGPLFRYHSWMSAFLGTSSYGELRKDLQCCVDGGSKALLVVVDSPGGEVNGMVELADAIYAARKQIPNMAAYVAGTGASAAYLLTSAVGKAYCSQTSAIGSIGVITTLTDYTKALDEAGIKEYEIRSTQSPKKSQLPGDPAYRDRVQARIDDMAQVFINSVAKYRGVSTATVMKQYGQGDVFVGQRAVDAGLVDAVSDVETVIASMQAQVNQTNSQPKRVIFQQPNGVMKMESKAMAKLLGLDENASEKQIEEHALALSHFQRDAMAASGTKSPDEALGKIRAGLVAIGERDALQAALKSQEQQSTQKEFRGELKAALKEGRLTMGELATVIPTFMKDEERDKAVAALSGVKSQERKELLDAVCMGQIGPKRIASVRAFIASRQSSAVVPAAKVQPGDSNVTAQAEVAQAAAIAVDPVQLREFGAKYGVKPELATALLGATTVEEAIAAKQKLAAVK